MTIYILLIVYILLLMFYAGTRMNDRKNQERFVLKYGMLGIFLVLALKGPSVGSDIYTYKVQYEIAALTPWNSWNYVYFEEGYLLLTKLFAKLGLPFQAFMVAVYAFSCYMLYRFIDKYSENSAFSLLIFLCYQFFVFYISGIRQMIAMSVCIGAYLLCDRESGRRWGNNLAACLLVLAASTIHQSALVFLAVVCIRLFNDGQLHLVPMLIFAVLARVLRGQIMLFIQAVVGRFKYTEAASLGNNFLVLVLLMAFTWIATLQYDFSVDPEPESLEKNKHRFALVFVHVMFALLGVQLAFEGTHLLRSSLYLSMFLIPGLPCILKRYERRIEILATCIWGGLFIYIFVTSTLLPNQLDLCPYVFFWE